jgi:hypothetical protein
VSEEELETTEGEGVDFLTELLDLSMGMDFLTELLDNGHRSTTNRRKRNCLDYYLDYS